MNKAARASFATAAVADLAAQAPKPVNPDEALWPNAGVIRSTSTAASAPQPEEAETAAPEAKLEKITFSNKLEAATYLQLQQLATYGGENIQQILEAALTAYFADKEEASRPLPPKALAALRRKYPFL